jgi:hypothetical protein
MRSTALFCCVLIALVFAGKGAAATINVIPGGDVAGAIGSANSGDTVVLGAGTFTVRSPITVPSGVTVVGVSPDLTHVSFEIDGDDQDSYAFVIPANASNITIEELDLYSNHGLIEMCDGSKYSDIVISHNNLEYGPGMLSDGTDVYGITATIPNDGLQIVHNFFHNSLGTNRNWCVFYASNANFDYNEFYRVNDGGQLMYPGPNVSFSYNYGTYVHRMGQECALCANSTILCQGNIFYDYLSPYYDTEGVSIVGDSGAVDIIDNFFDASTASGSTWGPADSGGNHRFGYAIECTGQPCNVISNTIVGSWASCVCSAIPNANVRDNNIYGSALWGDFDGETGGTVNTVHNMTDSKVSDAPSPPAMEYAGPRKHSL